MRIMPLSYDQRSEVRLAFDEAYVPADRRRDLRIRQRVKVELAPYEKAGCGRAFSAQVEDFSPGGVGISHSAPIEPGQAFVLKVPRRGAAELSVLLTCVRCNRREDGSYQIGMELSDVSDQPDAASFVEAMRRNRRLTSRRTKILLLILGIYGLGTCLLMR